MNSLFIRLTFSMVDQHPAIQRLHMLYSASSSSSSDSKLTDKGSCPGTFFHLFDWNCHSHHGRRLFGLKSNFFGKNTGDPTGKTSTDETVACALLAQDENRCGFYFTNKTSLENCLPKDQTPEKKKKKSPNVVAKLMGLETMPSPEQCRRQRRPLDPQSPNLLLTPDKTVYFPNMRVPSIKQQTHRGDGSCSSRLESSRKNLLPDLCCKHGNENGLADKQHSHAQMQSLGNDAVISSQTQVRVHKKLLSAARPAPPAFNSEGAQRSIKYDKITRGKSSEARSSKIECVTSPASIQADVKIVRGTDSTGAQTSHLATKARAENNNVGAATTTTSNVSAIEKEMGQASEHVKHAKNDNYGADGQSCNQHLGCKTDVGVKERFKKAEQTSKQLSQTAGLNQRGSRIQKAKVGSCPPKESLGRPDNPNNQRNLFADSTISCVQQAGPSCSTKSMSRHKRPSSSVKGMSKKNGNKIKLRKTGTEETMPTGVRIDREAAAGVVPICESTLYPKRPQRSHQHILIGHNKDTIDSLVSDVDYVTDAQNHLSHCGLEDGCIFDNALSTNLQEKSESLVSSLTFENGILGVELHDGDMQGTSEPCISCTFQDSSNNEASTRSILNVFENPKSTCQSLCESSIEDVGDTASSHEHKSQRHTVSYSGKSTATILKELLLALNPSTKGFITENVCTSEWNSSTLELNDVRKGRDADSICIDHIEGSVWNNRVVAKSPDEDLCHNQFQVDQPGNSNLAFVFPSGNEPAIGSEGLLRIQEKAACENISSKSRIKCKSFYPEGICSLMSSQVQSPNILGSWDMAMENEESYVQYMVRNANLSPARIISARLLYSGPLIEARLFDEVEVSSQRQWKWGIQHEHDEDNHLYSSDDEFIGISYATAAKTNRKLVFDCIEEALRRDVGINEQESMQTSLPVIDPPLYNICSKRVQRQIDDWRDMACGLNVDDMVEKEMNSGIGKWHNFSNEIYHISVEIELSILRDLIDELVPNLSSVIPIAPVMTRYKLQGSVKANKDKHFWVGL